MNTNTLQTPLSSKARELIEGPTNWIGGEWADGEDAEQITVFDPSTGEPIRTVQSASGQQAAKAVDAASRAFQGEWAQVGPQDRSRLLNQIADALEDHREVLEELVVAEVGAPINLARFMHVGMAIGNIRWAAHKAITGPRGGYEEALPPHMGPPNMASSLIQRVPVGVVSGITGYNFPIVSISWKLGPALAAGCSLVLKPSPRTPLSGLAMMKIIEQVDLPAGTLNYILGGTEAGQVMSSHDKVDMVMLTGSLEVGSQIMKAAAPATKRLVLELGGKSAAIILPGAPIEEVARKTVARFTMNSGQACGSTTRILVPRRDYDRYASTAEDFIKSMKIGMPWDSDTDMGPVIRHEHRDTVEGFVNRALEAGAKVIGGGGRPDLPGYFMNPTLVGDVDNTYEICREELFGPVAALMPYDSVDEAIRIAEDNQYGLNAAVWGDPAEAYEVAKKLRTGAVGINGGGFYRPDVPWGGFGRSGFGREMGEDGYSEFFETKWLHWPVR